MVKFHGLFSGKTTGFDPSKCDQNMNVAVLSLKAAVESHIAD